MHCRLVAPLRMLSCDILQTREHVGVRFYVPAASDAASVAQEGKHREHPPVTGGVVR